MDVDVKRLQYEKYAKKICTKQINLNKLIEKYLIRKKTTTNNCLLINLEKDTARYYSTIQEFNKISFDNHVHLKGTYWREKQNLEKDLIHILEFLKQFNPTIESNIQIDEFSETNDNNICIQDGPLACYCSHLRAMIYGYLHFSDYTVIVEDDIVITNTENIEKYLQKIPKNWDIVCFNSITKKQINKPLYKIKDEFHSTHFYVINNKCLPAIFKNMYPITDQVDVLLSNNRHKLNIYNITDSVYQKNIATNTQNNLHVIFNSPHYDVIRNSLNTIIQLCNFFSNKILPSNKKRNKIIVSNLMYDVIYHFILTDAQQCHKNQENYDMDITRYKKYPEFGELLAAIRHFIECSKKGIKEDEEAMNLLTNILVTISKFTLHNTIDKQFNEKLKAYSFGSTAHTYLLKKNNIIVKKYNDKLRWITEGHDDSLQIFTKELNMLKQLQLKHFPKLMGYDSHDKIIKLSYEGESLYNNFQLPKDWEWQINTIFDSLTKHQISYPELRLQNILVANDKITFIDFGLAKNFPNNTNNRNNFIKILRIMQEKFTKATDMNKRHQLYSTLFNNIDRLGLLSSEDSADAQSTNGN